MITVILFTFLAVLAVVGGIFLVTGNVNRKAGKVPEGNRKNPTPMAKP
jgi:hypothetical protein